MQKFGVVALAAFAALLVTLGFTSSAQAYPEVQITLTASKQVVSSGDTFTASASANVGCAWNVDWNGDARSGAGQFSTTFTAPAVTKVTKVVLTGTCTYSSGSSGSSGESRSAADLSTWTRQLTITVLPSASGAAAPSNRSSDLPSAGGPNKVFLLSGLVLLLAGASAVTLARRRAESELPAQTA
jgi:hypothetical protein